MNVNAIAHSGNPTGRECLLVSIYLTERQPLCCLASGYVCAGSQSPASGPLLFWFARNDKRCGLFAGLPDMFDGQTLSGHGLRQHVLCQDEDFWQ